MKPSQSRLKYIKGLLHSFYWRKVQTYLYLGVADLRIGFQNFMGFEGSHGSVWMCLSFLQMRKKEKYAKLKWILTSFVGVLIWVMMTDDDQVWKWVWILEVRYENRCEKWHFWSEIGSGYGELGGTHPRRIPRSIPSGSNYTLLIN